MSAGALREALQCSEHMLAAAQAGRWEELAALQVDREAVLQAAAAARTGGADPTDAECIARLLAINEEILALGAAHRDELMRACADSRQARIAVGAYAAGART